MSDLVSRKEVLDIICGFCAYTEVCKFAEERVEEPRCLERKAIKELPSKTKEGEDK